MESFQGQFQLYRYRMAFQKMFDRMVIGLVAEFPLNDTHDFTIGNRWVELLEVKDVIGHWFGVLMPLVPRMFLTLVYQTQHPFCDKPPCLLTDGCPLHFCFPTPVANRL